MFTIHSSRTAPLNRSASRAPDSILLIIIHVMPKCLNYRIVCSCGQGKDWLHNSPFSRQPTLPKLIHIHTRKTCSQTTILVRQTLEIQEKFERFLVRLFALFKMLLYSIRESWMERWKNERRRLFSKSIDVSLGSNTNDGRALSEGSERLHLRFGTVVKVDPLHPHLPDHFPALMCDKSE